MFTLYGENAASTKTVIKTYKSADNKTPKQPVCPGTDRVETAPWVMRGEGHLKFTELGLGMRMKGI